MRGKHKGAGTPPKDAASPTSGRRAGPIDGWPPRGDSDEAMSTTRYEASVTSLSWIPSEAVRGMTRLPFDVGVTRYDATPPDVITDLDALHRAGRFRFANRLSAWVEVDGGRISACGYSGGGLIAPTEVRVGAVATTFAPAALPDRRNDAEVGGSSVRFVQTAGGRTGMPAPRRVARSPFVQISAPLAWTTLSLTINSDGSSCHELVGASPFPRHWVYDTDGRLALKSGLVDFKTWWQNAFGKHTPWGDEDSPALVTAVETALERELSEHIMRGGAKPSIDKVSAGRALVTQGDKGTDVFLLLDGVVAIDVDGAELAQLGPGVVLGERAVLEGGRRTATIRAVTACRVATIRGDQLDPRLLSDLAAGHRREDG